MKKHFLFFGLLLIGLISTVSAPANAMYRNAYDGSAFIFVEGNVEFSVFPDGQFDFVYLGPRKNNRVVISSPNVNISFNAGYNYDAYVQYDSYGAVIQVENIPIYYDYYGRIIRAGNVEIRYENNRLVRIGGLYIFYNPSGYYSHYSGVINVHNPYYIRRPWHVYYIRPVHHHVIVYNYPYRKNYNPVRYSYNDYRRMNAGRKNSGRQNFIRPGSRIHYPDGRVAVNPDFNGRSENTLTDSRGRNNTSASRSAASSRISSDRTQQEPRSSSSSGIRNTNSTPERAVQSGRNSTPAVRNPVSQGRTRTVPAPASTSSGRAANTRNIQSPAGNSRVETAPPARSSTGRSVNSRSGRTSDSVRGRI